MSMLTAKAKRLRERAKELRQGDWSDGADDARMMDDAADTIENLRNRLTETCHDTRETPLGFVCSECGSVTSGFWPRYCPWCGRLVV